MENFIQTQKIRQNWILILLGISLVTIITLAIFFYKDKTAFLLITTSAFFLVLITLWIFNLKMNLSISNDSIEYSIPLLFTKGRIMWAGSKSIELRRSNPINDFGGWGLRYNSKGYKGYIFEGDYCLYLVNHEGKKRAFSIITSESLVHFFSLLSEKNNPVENITKKNS